MQDLMRNSQAEYPLDSSAFRRIRMSKRRSDQLLEYRVDFECDALIAAVKEGLGSGQDEDQSSEVITQHSTWVPDPILRRYLPEMVAAYDQVHPRTHLPANIHHQPVREVHVSKLFTNHNLDPDLYSHSSPVRTIVLSYWLCIFFHS
jgi:hypothetical protein